VTEKRCSEVLHEIQVADVLSDIKLPCWLGIVARRILNQDWKGDQSESILCELLLMPQHLLLAAMQKLCEDKMLADGTGGFILDRYIAKLPASLHAALLSSLTSE
jgi:hypothetical protein